MQPDAFISTAIAVATSLITIGVCYGMTKSKLENLKEKVDSVENRLEDNDKRFVTIEHFKDTIRPIRDQMSEMRGDIKSILMIVSKNAGTRSNRTTSD